MKSDYKLKMKVLSVLVLCFYFCLVASKSYINDRKTEVDLVIEYLKYQEWLEDERQCLDQTLLILNNVRNYTVWAVWIWNSMQHPTGSFYGSRYNLGSYDQCLQAPSNFANSKIITQYCLADVKLTNRKEKKYGSGDVFGTTEEFLNVKNIVGRKSDVITWGACLPAVCDHRSVSKILKTMHSVNPITSIDPDITVDYCQKAGAKTEYSIKFYVFLILMIALITTVILSSLYLEYDSSDTALTRIAYSFSLKRNWYSFIRSSDKDIPVISFLKAFLVSFNTGVHVFVFTIMTGAISNAHDLDRVITVKNYALGNMVQHIDLLSLDNFFVISGLLLMKGLIEKRKPIKTLIQRYVRLTGSLSLLVFYMIAVSEYTGDGPLWSRFNEHEKKLCSKNWHLGLLMLNNYVDSENICQIITWYIPCDYHLAVMGTALYCLWKRDSHIGKVTTTITIIVAVLLPGISTYWNRLPGILVYDMDEMIRFRTNAVYLTTYMRSHHRAGSYLIGMATGYIIMPYRPVQYRGIISKKYSYIGIAVAFLVGFKVLVAAPAWCLGEYNAWNSAVYAALNKTIWALATCTCIMITEYGDVQTLRNFMACPIFSIVSRLAYGIYITHSVILQRNLYSQRNPVQYDMFQLILNGLGVFVISAVLAILLWLFVESPLSNLANLILNQSKAKMKQTLNGTENKKETDGLSKITDLKKTKAL